MGFIEYRGEVRELTPGETVVGSGSQAGWRLQQADLAARHFAVTTGLDGAARVRCVAGQHVVAVNGRSVGGEPVTLAPGDVIAAGTARFLYLDRADAPRPADWERDTGEIAYLVNEHEREGYALDRRAMTIGRDAASNIHLQDPSVSRFHADIRREAGLFVLYAMGSAGTKINGQRVAGPVVLEPGDRIEIGDSVLQFSREKPSVPLARGSDTQENRITRRPTMLQARAVETGEFGKQKGGRGTMLTVGIAIAAVIIAVLVYRLLL